MKDVMLCQICKEPIHNFACIDCLAKDIKNWLPVSLSNLFTEFNEWFLSVFDYHKHEVLEGHHLVCNARGSGNICIYCYVNEVFQWIAGQDKAVAKRFRHLFSFGMKKTDFREVMLAHAEPISEVETVEKEFGICDECGEYADELKLLNGRWVCMECGGS